MPVLLRFGTLKRNGVQGVVAHVNCLSDKLNMNAESKGDNSTGRRWYFESILCELNLLGGRRIDSSLLTKTMKKRLNQVEWLISDAFEP